LSALLVAHGVIRLVSTTDRILIPHSLIPDWNTHDEFFHFTRGRFVIDEVENLRKRTIKFDMNKFACIAAKTIGALQCVSIMKYPDGMFNKAFLMTMDDGRQAVPKVPNPNEGIPHFTTASEVATVDFVRSSRYYRWLV
jgi:hypothetical protein